MEPVRQRLAFHKVPMSNDDLTLQAYGVKDGDTLHLAIQRTGNSLRNRPALVTEASQSLREHPGLAGSRGCGDAWLIPRWVSQDNPKLIGRIEPFGTPTPGIFKDRQKEIQKGDWGVAPIYMPDMHENSLSRVRVAVTGSKTYV